jgi:hypothetical protein
MPKNPYEEASRRAKAETDAEQRVEMDRLKPDESALQALLPEPADQDAIRRLVEVVRASTDRNEQLAALQGNIGRFGDVLLRLLDRLA